MRFLQLFGLIYRKICGNLLYFHYKYRVQYIIPKVFYLSKKIFSFPSAVKKKRTGPKTDPKKEETEEYGNSSSSILQGRKVRYSLKSIQFRICFLKLNESEGSGNLRPPMRSPHMVAQPRGKRKDTCVPIVFCQVGQLNDSETLPKRFSLKSDCAWFCYLCQNSLSLGLTPIEQHLFVRSMAYSFELPCKSAQVHVEVS